MSQSIYLNGTYPTDSRLDDLNRNCDVCKKHQASPPRVFPCLHALCEECLLFYCDADDTASVCPDCQLIPTVESGLSSVFDVHNLSSDEQSSEQPLRKEIEKLLMSAEVKVDEAVKNLITSLNKLHKKLRIFRKEVKHNCENFKQVLGICRENALIELENLHSERELNVTELLHDVEESVAKITDSLNDMRMSANNVEITCAAQIVTLIKYAPQVDGSFTLHPNVKQGQNRKGRLSMQHGLENASMLNDWMPAVPSIGTMPTTDKGQRNVDDRSIMQIRWKFGSLGVLQHQFFIPHGFCLGTKEEVIVADTNNHRIAVMCYLEPVRVFAMNGSFIFEFGVAGTGNGQLWYPRKVAVIRRNDRIVVCDRGNERSRMQIFTKNGNFVNRIFIAHIGIVACLAVTNDGRIVVVDSVTPSVCFIAEDGTLLKWFKCDSFVKEPSDIAISGSYYYICDFKGHSVAVFTEDGKFQYRIGHETITRFPNGIHVTGAGDVLIGDSHGNRFHMSCYSRDGILRSELICPSLNVSRCCGLKITSEGYIVTLAKNNHHVLVLISGYQFNV